MELKREQLAPGVFLTAIETTKFKSATLSATFLTPLEREKAAVNAIVPYILRRGCERWPTMEAVSTHLDELYGGMLEPAVRKKGESQCLGLIGSFLDDAYTLEGERVLEPAAELLCAVLLQPVTEQGVFRAEYVSGERENLLLAIRAQMNDKRQYAMVRLVQEMCKDEAYGVDRLGGEADAAAITAQSAWNAYQDLLAHGILELHYCGSAPMERVKAALKPLADRLAPLRGETVELDCQVREDRTGQEPRTVVDHLDVTQGKLCLGFRTGGACVWKENYPALLVFNALYGGTATSKLFLNVREKLSLCYYASASTDSLKGVCAVSSGVEFDRMDQAQAEILAQLESVKAGDFTDEDLQSARQAVVNVYKSVLDSRSQLEQFCLTAAVSGVWDDTPQETARRAEAVTADQVAAIAQGLELDTVYRLMGKEG